MDEKGLNQAGLAHGLGVSRTIVSAWFKGRKFPRPDKLLKLGLQLGLPFQDLVIKSVTASEPIVAFRKKGRRKTTDLHVENAKKIGQLLDELAPYLPFEGLFQPPSLKEPKLNYSYIQKTRELFGSPFFEALGVCLAENEKSSGFIQSILDCSILDAKEIHAELIHLKRRKI